LHTNGFAMTEKGNTYTINRNSRVFDVHDMLNIITINFKDMRKFFITAMLGLSLGFSLNLSAQKAETPKFIGNVEIDFGLRRGFQQKINFL